MTARCILVTGATGGLGRAIVREALARGHRVRATGRARDAGAELASAGAEFVPLDLTEDRADLARLLAGADSVLHAAALSATWGHRRAFEAANVEATERLLDAAGRAGARRFVYVSSPSIFAAFRHRTGIGGDDPPAARPLNHYARTKLRAERMVLARTNPEMACCAIRPRALVGPGDRVILPRLAELARRRHMPLPRGGRALIELTDLRDAARAICEAEERAPWLGGKALNISGGRPVAVRTVASQVAQALGEAPRLLDVPLAIAFPLSGALELIARLRRSALEPALTGYSLATLAYTQTMDLEPARRLLGYEPRYDALATLLDEARKLPRRVQAA